MNWTNITQRQKEITGQYVPGQDVSLAGTGVTVRHYPFESTCSFQLTGLDSCQALMDGAILENRRFTYPVFSAKSRRKATGAIVLLHGLNERNWDKYLCWAEYLTLHTGKPVVLFPIAYHMNRSPELWSDPRSMSLLVRKRQESVGVDRSLCFANVALSERLSEDPVRFYTSGRQTIEDLRVLAHALKSGSHPLFSKGADIDFFAYSIGAFLAEITLMANQDRLFDRSRLFVFCGGSIFRSMFGESRCIMDKTAYDRLLDFYLVEWLEREHKTLSTTPAHQDDTRLAFDMMIKPELFRDKRERFFTQLGNRIAGISLRKDIVMPFRGVEECMGRRLAGRKFQLLDFPFDYSHEAPFPSNSKVEPDLVNASFRQVFSKAARFLS